MEMNFDVCSHEWVVFKNNEFSVVIKHWQRKGWNSFSGEFTKENMVMINHWNVYANVFEGTELFDNIERLESAPWHGGVTYQEKFTQRPAKGIQYDWQKEHSYYKYGSDYAHVYDEHFETEDGKDGIPYEIQGNARALVNWLLNKEEV